MTRREIVSAYRMQGLRIVYRRGDAQWVRRVLRATCIWGTIPYISKRGLVTAEELETLRAAPRIDYDRPNLSEVLALRGAEVVS